MALLSARCATATDPDSFDEDAGVELEEDGGFFEEDGGAPEEDGGPAEEDGGAALDGGPRADGGRSDGGADGGAHDGGADAGVRADGGLADGGADAGAPDAGATCDAPIGTTSCGASKIFESTDTVGPSAFDFAAGRALFLLSEVTPQQGDVYLFSLETATQSPGAADALSFVAPRDSAGSGGDRGLFRNTGIEDLSARDGGPSNPDRFTFIPSSQVLRAATRGTTHRVPVVAGHIYGLQLDLDVDGGSAKHAAIYVDRIVTPAQDGGVRRQFIEMRWMLQNTPGRRTFDRSFGPPP